MEKNDDTPRIITHYIGLVDTVDGIYREVHGTGYARQPVRGFYSDTFLFLCGQQFVFRFGEDWSTHLAGFGIFDELSGGELLQVHPCKERIPMWCNDQIVYWFGELERLPPHGGKDDDNA